MSTFYEIDITFTKSIYYSHFKIKCQTLRPLPKSFLFLSHLKKIKLITWQLKNLVSNPFPVAKIPY